MPDKPVWPLGRVKVFHVGQPSLDSLGPSWEGPLRKLPPLPNFHMCHWASPARQPIDLVVVRGSVGAWTASVELGKLEATFAVV